MPRIPDQDLQRLKEEVSVQRLVEASGVALRKGGKDFTGKCPFHADETASLVVTPHKNLWHCFGCQIGGGPIDWVMKARGVSFRHAVELLKAELAGGGVPSLAAEAAVAKRSTVRTLPAPVALDADDQALLAQTLDYYHQRLKESPEALAYLKARGLDPALHPTLIDTFRLGVADRTLGLRLPEKNRKDGAAIRERLQRIGLLRESGHEHFNGSLVVPVFDEGGPEGGNAVEVYGRKLRDDLRPGTPKHLYLPGPREQSEPRRSRGVFNLAGVAAAGQREPGQREVILTEALIDTMTFWAHGFQNVTSAYGIEGFTAEILAAFKAHSIERVLIAYDRDDAGERAADKLAAQLIAEGFEVLRVVFPKGMDANAYAKAMSPAGQAFALVLRQARWMGSGRPAPVESLEAEPVDAIELEALPALAAKTGPSNAAPVPTAEPADDIPAELPDELRLPTGACEWRIRAWKKNPSPEAMRVNLQVRRVPGGEPDADMAVGYHMDTLDLYAARARAAFVRQAAIELGWARTA